MDYANTKSPFWMASIKACTVSPLFIVSSFTANRANSEPMGVGVNGCSLRNTLRSPKLISFLFMVCLYQCNTLSTQNTQQNNRLSISYTLHIAELHIPSTSLNAKQSST